MLHAMPLVWCSVLSVLFAAYLAAGFRAPAAASAGLLALAASIVGLRPWMQVALGGIGWVLLRLIFFLRANS